MKTSCLYTARLVISLCIFSSCGSGDNNTTINTADSNAVKAANDSMNAVHNTDPTTAYPQPPVTGSQVDSSRTKDSLKGVRDSAMKAKRKE